MPTATNGRYGNGKPDAMWLDNALAEGKLFAVEEEDRPADCFYEFNYQWDGDAEELDRSWWDPFYRSERRCNGTAYVRDEAGMYVADNEWQRLTRPCLSIPIRGGDVCQQHGGRIPQVIEAANRRLQQASEIVALRLIGMTNVRDEEGVRIRPQDRIVAMGSVLDRAGIRAGTELDVKATGFNEVLGDLFGNNEEEPSNGAE